MEGKGANGWGMLMSSNCVWKQFRKWRVSIFLSVSSNSDLVSLARTLIVWNDVEFQHFSPKIYIRFKRHSRFKHWDMRAEFPTFAASDANFSQTVSAFKHVKHATFFEACSNRVPIARVRGVEFRTLEANEPSKEWTFERFNPLAQARKQGNTNSMGIYSTSFRYSLDSLSCSLTKPNVPGKKN